MVMAMGFIPTILSVDCSIDQLMSLYRVGSFRRFERDEKGPLEKEKIKTKYRRPQIKWRLFHRDKKKFTDTVLGSVTLLH